MGEKTYSDIIQTVMDSDPKDDWVWSCDGRKTTTSIRFFRDDLNLRFELIGPSHDEDDIYYANRDFKEDWANSHPNPKAWSYFVRLYCASTLIKSFILVAGDGGRAFLLMPKANDDFTFKDLDYKVAQIHDSSSTLDEYIERSIIALSSGDKDD